MTRKPGAPITPHPSPLTPHPPPPTLNLALHRGCLWPRPCPKSCLPPCSSPRPLRHLAALGTRPPLGSRIGMRGRCWGGSM